MSFSVLSATFINEHPFSEVTLQKDNGKELHQLGEKYVSTLKFFYIIGLSVLYAYNIFYIFRCILSRWFWGMCGFCVFLTFVVGHVGFGLFTDSLGIIFLVEIM